MELYRDIETGDIYTKEDPREIYKNTDTENNKTVKEKSQMAIVTKENERLYLRSWEYNAALIISRLAEKVTKEGGRVKPTKTAIISNSTLDNAIRDIEIKIALYRDHIQKGVGNPEKLKQAINRYCAKLSELNSIGNDAISVTHTRYISFVFNDTYYYYQIDNNMFFPFYYIKTPVLGENRSLNACLEEDPKNWFSDNFLKFTSTENEIETAANTIFQMLKTSKNSIIRRDTHKIRVPNNYNSGWHWETKTDPERFEKIDF